MHKIQTKQWKETKSVKCEGRKRNIRLKENPQNAQDTDEIIESKRMLKVRKVSP